MYQITITVEFEETKREVLDVLANAEVEGDITEAFQVHTDEVISPYVISDF